MRAIKHAAVVCFTFAAAVVLVFALAVLPNRLAFKGAESYSFFVGNTSKNCRVVTCSAQNASLTRLTLGEISGESATFSSLDIDNFLEGVKGEIVFTETLSDSVNYYCTADLPYSVFIYETKINLHICVKEDSVTVASPIIFGGY
ncbi:MAG: hypothetical protein K2K39_00465 [Clostridia bacterium]|nr:hypothetical protein [Clostridia bacterium]